MILTALAGAMIEFRAPPIIITLILISAVIGCWLALKTSKAARGTYAGELSSPRATYAGEKPANHKVAQLLRNAPQVAESP
jgi:hypothetical protein